jgi:hypothetical protein
MNTIGGELELGNLILPAIFSIFLGTSLLLLTRIRQRGTVSIGVGGRHASFSGTLPFVLITLGIMLWALDSLIPAI